MLVTLISLLLAAASVSAQSSLEDWPGLATDQPPAFSEPVQPDRYLVRPGDTLIITFIDAQLSSRRFVVMVDGSVVDQVLGRIQAGGLMLSEVQKSLGVRLAEAYRVEEFDISVAGPLRLAMMISGEVQNPGVYSAYSSQRTSELLAQSGGLTINGSQRNIQLIGPSDTFTVDLVSAFVLGDADANPFLAAGSRIHVPSRSTNVVAVQGEVRRPTEIELKDGDSIDQLIDFAGGLSERADGDGVVIIRDGTRLPAQRSELKAGDVVFVPVDEEYEPVVSVFGAVESPGRFSWRDGLTLTELIHRAGGATRNAVMRRATVFRRAGAAGGGRMAGYRYPVQAAGTDDRLELQPSDSVVVPEALGYVRVTGQVQNPGYYPLQPDQTARYYVEAAGGFLPDAERNRLTRTNRVSGMSSEVSPDVLVFDGDIVSVQSREEQP